MRPISVSILFCLVSCVLNAQQNTTTTLTSSQNPANSDQSIAFTATVLPASAVGSVTLFLGTKVFTVLPLGGGTATLQTQMPLGTYAFTAAYSGDQNDKPSTSAVLTQVVTSQPVPTLSSVVNAAGGDWPTSGSAASIYGTFPGVTTGAAGAGVPLPYMLDGISVFVDGIRAPLYFVSASQINIQVPWEVVDRTATISVSNGIWNLTLGNSVLSSWPGLFSLVLHSADYSLVTSNNPAVGGEVVLLYATGLGPVSNTPVDGTPAPDAPLAVTTNPPEVSIGGEAASVLWSGLAPGFVGLYQINVQVPAGLHGTGSVVATAGGAQSNPVSMAIK